MASQQLAKVLEIIASQPSNPNAPIDRMRAGMEKVAERVAPDIKCEPVDAAGVPAEWIIAPNAASDRAILYLHGGGYVMGSINTHRAMIARISRAAEARVLAINYRLAPEHPFPAAVDDATSAYRWMLGQGCLPERIVVAGDSAGGGLTFSTLVALRDSKTPLPAAAVPISPWTDLAATGESLTTRAKADPMVGREGLMPMARHYAGSNDLRHPLISPLYADLRGLPPLLIHVGDAEILLDDSTRIAERARAAGVNVTLEVWPEMIHVWHVFAKILPEAQQAIDRIGEFVKTATA